MIKRLLPVLLVLAACDGSDPTSSNARLDFETVEQDGARAVLTPHFESVPGGVRVTGVFSTPCINDRATAALTASGSRLVLTVSRVPSEACFTAIGYIGYTATVSGLRPGEHRVRVVYNYGSSGGIHQAGEAAVDVQ
jgi:hypothetical protein